MELYANALLYAIPFFSLLIVIELIAGRIKNGNFNFFSNFDTISSLSSGFTNVIRDVLGIGVLSLVAYPFILKHINIINIGNEWYVYLLTIICLDFAGYWTHRIAHYVNYFWNGHVIHHSSERYTLGCALRQSFTPEITLYGIFLIPAAILGIPVEVIVVIAPIHLFAQFWYHTELIGNLGFIEWIIVTPQQHSVHHAINKEYIDRNFSQIFNIWDRLFGTFQELIPGVKPVYGVTRPPRTWNPYKIGLYHIWQITKDAWRTSNWMDKLTIWVRPLGWRPKDVIEKHPIKSIKDVYSYKEYNSNPSLFFTIWAWTQLLFTLLLLTFLFYQFSFINSPGQQQLLVNSNGEIIGYNLAAYTAFLLFNIYAYTSVMDREEIGGVLIAMSSAFGLFILFWLTNGSWFNIDSVIPFSTVLLVLLFSFSGIGGILLTQTLLAEGPNPELVEEF